MKGVGGENIVSCDEDKGKLRENQREFPTYPRALGPAGDMKDSGKIPIIKRGAGMKESE